MTKKKKHAGPKMAKSASAKLSIIKSVSIEPTDDNVVVRPLSPDEAGMTTTSGIIIPDSAKEKPEQGTVVAVGPGRWEEGMRVPMPCTVGDRVIFGKYGYEEVKVGGVEYYLVSASSIKAVIKK